MTAAELLAGGAHRRPITPTVGTTPGSFVVTEREVWLVRAVQLLRSYFAGHGLELPTRVTVRVGDPQVTANGRAAGECWPSGRTPEKVPGIMINQTLNDPIVVLRVLVHELIHAADDCRDGHGRWFSAWARALGLDIRAEGTRVAPSLGKFLTHTAQALGPYPHARYQLVFFTTGRAVA